MWKQRRKIIWNSGLVYYFLYDLRWRSDISSRLNIEFGPFCFTMLTESCFSGFVVSCCCDNERTATYMSLGSFFPLVFLCGIIWPVEAMNDYLRLVSVVLPLTQATESMRSTVARGWPISNPIVYEGFVSLIIWILVFLTISILVLKFKKGWDGYVLFIL